MFISKLKNCRLFSTKSNNSFYVTTPIFYVNAAPHIGHLYSAVIADAICRYKRLRQPVTDVRLCTGTDEHGTKIQQSAAANSVEVGKYCEDISMRYRQLFKDAHVDHSDFIRTTEERHKRGVAEFWRTLHSREHIYTAQYSGWYCVSDETFLTESQLHVDKESGKRVSLESGHVVEWTEETNYMFRLSALQPEVLYWAKHQNNHIRPAKFQKILLDTLNEPLPDVSISRPTNRVHWAIPVPDDPTQTVYVWLDALINYLTSAGYPDSRYRAHWPPSIQVIGKDILKFHGIYWPAFLIAAGLEPPQQLFVHSHWTVDGEKMSKSKQNVVDPQEVATTYSMEGLRYFLFREGVAHSDGNYSSTKALRILNSELADTLGNLLSRACAKSLNPRQIYPRLHVAHLDDFLLRVDAAQRLVTAIRQLDERCSQHYDDNNFYLVVDTIMATLHAANNFFEASRPWELKDDSHLPTASGRSTANNNIENTNRLETIIAMTMDVLRLCGIVLQPIIPELSGRLLDKLNVPLQQRLWCNLSESFIDGAIAMQREEHPLGSTDAVLFRRIQLKDQNALDKTKILLPAQRREKVKITKQKTNKLAQ